MSEESDWNAQIIEEFRANAGKLGGMFEGADVLLLHHTGSKTGVERVSPLGYQRIGSAYAVFGSNSGRTSASGVAPQPPSTPTHHRRDRDRHDRGRRPCRGGRRTCGDLGATEGEHPAVRRVRADGEP